MQHSVIENLLKETIGLDPDSIGSASISRVIRRRSAECGYDDADEYIKVLMSSEDELYALIEAIVVPETWFFRDGKPFTYLNDYIKEEWLRKHKNEQRILRILSIPSSTGEEPYSIAMVLSNLNFPVSQCQIDAVDISFQAINRARMGVYKENSFRGDEMDYRDRYFEKENNLYRLDRKICQMVHFFQGNLLDRETFPIKGPYNVIFCRNLLIYFDRDDQKRAIMSLYKLLAEDGILFIGHAEASQVLNDQFSAMRYLGAFAYRKSSKDRPASRNQLQEKFKTSKTKTGVSSLPAVTVIKPKRPFNSETNITEPEPQADTSDQIEVIRKIADEGRLGEATSLCEQYLVDHPESAPAYYLAGVLYDAAGDMQHATEMYRKTVYLDPDHHEALTHLSLHAERNGNKAASINLRRRAQRAAERYKSSVK